MERDEEEQVTQRQRVLSALEQAPDGICARFFIYQMHPGIPRVAARILELRNDGYDVRSEPCRWSHSESAAHIQYRLIPTGAML
jgi:hypothetical protein